ncbi:hypothetical protein VXJ24_10930 [Olsenella sp. YH-ols2221]|uniref:hypothetical protein n=1 Tax=Olsenella kribbiana TaxID=3115221 RepID=UPI002ED9BEE5
MTKHTVAPGRGKEFSDAEGLQEALGAPACFCHPRHPWERGTDESTNGLLRDWFPKGGSLGDVSGSEVQEACDPLSRRPRRRLRWKCPWEVCHRQSLHLLWGFANKKFPSSARMAGEGFFTAQANRCRSNI